MTDPAPLFTDAALDAIFPPERTHAFFDALYGDAEDGAYDIRLRFHKAEGNTWQFFFHLLQRPGKCLACNLTYGLPQVFIRHPVIALPRLVEDLCAQAGVRPTSWNLGSTQEISRSLHRIPLTIHVQTTS
ncbi:MAG: hypothetical protein PWQ64_219 [Desulfomicrobiaceae bacterium]|nr:hypothetical protein [Desulfomicrobiaceae bacterium]